MTKASTAYGQFREWLQRIERLDEANPRGSGWSWADKCDKGILLATIKAE